MSKTVAQKLLIKPGSSVWFSSSEHLDLIEGLPEDVTICAKPEGTAIIFAENESGLRSIVKKHAKALLGCPTVWVVYPKGNKVDINRDSIWPILYEFGMRPNSQVAVDEVWSALRFRALRPGEPAFKPA